MDKIKAFLISIVFNFLYKCSNIAPEIVTKMIGRGFGKILYFFNVRKEVARNNLELAFGDLYSQGEREKILKESYIHFGQVLIEFLLIEKLNKKEWQNRISIENFEKLKELLESEQGVIFYTAHFGNWEWLAAAIAKYDSDCLSIERKQRLGNLGDKINQIRSNVGVKTTTATSKGLINIYKNLKTGNSTMILGDQHASGLPHVMNFFGQPASIHRGAVRLATKTDAIILPIFIHREAFAKYKVQLGEAVSVPRGIKKADEPGYLEPLLRSTEEAIRQSPEQWLWFHKRWKVDRGEG